MSILLTGGLGYIGSHTAVELSNAGYHVILFDNLCNAKESTFLTLQQLCPSHNLTFVQGDILYHKDLEKVFHSFSIDCVVHFAARKAVSESLEKPILYYQNNVTGLLNVLAKCRDHNVRRFIFSSSATVYGDSVSPLCESSTTGRGITNPYGKSKWMCEEILKDFCEANKYFSCICLRYFNPVGAHASGLLGEDPNDVPNNLMPYLMRVAVKNNLDSDYGSEYDTFCVYGKDYETQDGTAERDYIHVVDLAKSHLAATEVVGTAKINFDVINIGTGKSTSVLTMISTFENVNKIKLPFVFHDRRPGDLESVYCDGTKAREMLLWQPQYNIADMCRHAYKFAAMNHHQDKKKKGVYTSSLLKQI